MSAFYADVPAVRARQLAADAGWLLLVLASVLAGRAVSAAVSALADPARRFSAGAEDLAGQLRGAGTQVADAPLLGDDLAGPLTRAADGASALSGAGSEQVAALAHLASVLGVVTALAPIVLVTLLRWVPRWRWARRAAAARRWASTPGGRELLALRALQTGSARELLALDAEPAAAWRRGDPEVVARLADLQLRSLGVLTPRAGSSPGASAGGSSPAGPSAGGSATPHP